MKLLSSFAFFPARRHSYWVSIPLSIHLIGLVVGLLLAVALLIDVYLGHPLRGTIAMLSACAVAHLVFCGSYAFALIIRAKVLENRARREAAVSEVMDS